MSFPVVLTLTGRPCRVIGGGAEAEAKIADLFDAGAAVDVIALSPAEGLERLAAAGRIQLQRREFRRDDLAGAALVLITHRLDPDRGAELLRQANAANVLLWAVDQPAFSNVTMPAVVKRGSLRVAIATGGVSPALARRLRQDLEGLFDSEFKAFLEWLALRRREIQAAEPDADRRIERLRASIAGFRLRGRISYPIEWFAARSSRKA